MATRRLLFPDDIRAQLYRRYQLHHRAWLDDAAEWPLQIKLGSPNELDAQQHADSIQAWILAWQSWHGTGELEWCEKRWRTLGIQRLPERISLHQASEVAAWVGETQRWEKATIRYHHITSRWPVLTGIINKYFDMLTNYTDLDFQLLEAMLAWLQNNPQSLLYPRQLPIAGIDSKWLEQRKSLIANLVATLQNDAHRTLDFYQRCGLKQVPPAIRIRILDPHLRSQIGGLEDITMPITQLSHLNIPVTRVYIVENLQTGLAFNDIPGSIVIMQLGYSVDLLANISWLQKTNCLYWGDIDTHGFAILNRARSYLPHLKSILMDVETLQLHQQLWVTEDKQHAAMELPSLTTTENSIYQGLKSQRWGNHIRLEQERINWDYAEYHTIHF